MLFFGQEWWLAKAKNCENPLILAINTWFAGT
jgi:hypothetical protein